MLYVNSIYFDLIVDFGIVGTASYIDRVRGSILYNYS